MRIHKEFCKILQHFSRNLTEMRPFFFLLIHLIMSLWGFSKISRQAHQIVAHCWEKHCWTEFSHHVNLILKARPATCSSVFSIINPGEKILLILLHCVRLHLLVSAFHLQPFLLRALRSASQTCSAWLRSTVSAGKYICFALHVVARGHFSLMFAWWNGDSADMWA